MPPDVPNTIIELYGVICRLGNWFFIFVMVIAVITFLRGALEYLMGGGNDEQVKRAKQLITYAIIGVIVALLAKSIIFVIGDLLDPSLDVGSFFTGECS